MLPAIKYEYALENCKDKTYYDSLNHCQEQEN